MGGLFPQDTSLRRKLKAGLANTEVDVIAAVAAGYGTPVLATDPGTFVILVHGNGADESTDFYDKSFDNKGIGTDINLEVDTGATDPWGGNIGMMYAADAGRYVEFADHVDWDISANWTLHMIVKFATGEPNDQEFLAAQYEDVDNCWYLSREADESLLFKIVSGGVSIVTCQTGIDAITDTDLHHIVIAKKADEYGIYVDGAQLAYVDDDSMDTFTGVLRICTRIAGVDGLVGHMAEFFISPTNYFDAAPNDTGGTGDDAITPLTAPIEGSFVNPANAVDDDATPPVTFAFGDVVKESITIDLGGLVLCSGIRIYWGSTIYNATDYDIDYSVDGGSWVEIENYTAAAPADAWKEYDFPPALCQLIRIQINTHGSSGETRILEIEKYTESVSAYFSGHAHNLT